MFKRGCIFFTAVLFCLLGTAEVFAQPYPQRPITMVIPMAPGDAIDVAGRLMADELSKLLKVPVVPVNKPGAAATVGSDTVAKAKKDGYTILFTNNASLIYTKILQPEIVPYDSFKDLAPLGLSTIWPTIITTRKDAPFKSLAEMLDYGKKNPGKLRCGTMGANSVGDFNVGLLQTMTGVDITAVPFKGASPAITALLGGHVEIVSVAMPPLLGHLRSGEMKGLVLSRNFSEFPGIPTIRDLGYKQEMFEAWGAYFTTAGVPSQVTETLVQAIGKVVRDPGIGSKLAHLGMIQEFLGPDKLAPKMEQEYKTVEEIAKKFGMVK
jgi:tripartite-type tricarboxylate transporter receptor subunit TctC